MSERAKSPAPLRSFGFCWFCWSLLGSASCTAGPVVSRIVKSCRQVVSSVVSSVMSFGVAGSVCAVRASCRARVADRTALFVRCVRTHTRPLTRSTAAKVRALRCGVGVGSRRRVGHRPLSEQRRLPSVIDGASPRWALQAVASAVIDGVNGRSPLPQRTVVNGRGQGALTRRWRTASGAAAAGRQKQPWCSPGVPTRRPPPSPPPSPPPPR